ncbi:SUN2 protein, partial [Nothocercus nigrocapillus]|nr:SUN2 protein [Nothocercus nigrocapillus]
QPNTRPGQCWAFQGAQGQAVTRLPQHIWPGAVTVEHISKAVSPSGEVSSAPKDFAVFGMDEEGPEEDLLGLFAYDVEQEAVQTFHLKKQLPRAFQFIKFQVRSNWGKREYTCLYQVQVQGILAAQ